jgi:phosphoserine phosphatase
MQECKLVIFEMDGILLNGKTIEILADKKGFSNELQAILESEKQPHEKSVELASKLNGMKINEALNIFKQIPLQDQAEAVIQSLRGRRIKIALITDSYQRFANILKKRLNLDFAFGNRLIIKNQLITEKLLIQNLVLKPSDDGKIYSINKRDILEFLCMILDITEENVIVVGNQPIDIDILECAGLGIAFQAPIDVQRHADLSANDLRVILDYIKE